MNSLKRSLLIATVLVSGSLFAADDLKVLSCTNGLHTSPGALNLEATLVVGKPLAGGVLELKPSSETGKYQSSGHYIRITETDPTTIYAGEGASLTIPKIQNHDLPVGKMRGWINAKSLDDNKSIPVLCSSVSHGSDIASVGFYPRVGKNNAYARTFDTNGVASRQIACAVKSLDVGEWQCKRPGFEVVFVVGERKAFVSGETLNCRAPNENDVEAMQSAQLICDL
jgi:hypothetical protein